MTTYWGVAPVGWHFPGISAFVCFSPYNNLYFSDVLNPSAKKKKFKSQSSHREEVARAIKFTSEVGSKYGLPMHTKVHMCSVAQNNKAVSMRERESNLLNLSLLVDSKQ